MWILIILGIILLASNWVVPTFTHQQMDFLWVVGVVALVIGVIWMIFHNSSRR